MGTYLELLAPAKNLECGMEAILHGADAVYIGAERFGARAAAGNSLEDIARLVRFAHLYDASVYVTVNTLLNDDELPEAAELLCRLNDINVDAVLIQDLRLLDYAPDGLTLHASTQTDCRSLERVKELAAMGLTRVVVAREMSLDDIRQVHKALPGLEIECFVHGALCVSYSGACYASEHCFRRSANRGECAQFCRLPFDLIDAEGKTLARSKHLLSLKDMCRIDHLEELADAGVTSFKIEGRLKDAVYVKNVVTAYSHRLDQLCADTNGRYRRASYGKSAYTFRPDLRRSFNRGYTDYFLHGRKPGIENIVTPKSVGMPVGKVKDRANYWFSVATSEPFANGDGLCFVDEKQRMQGFRINKVEGNRLFPQQMPPDLKKGTMLFRNHDEAFTKALSGKTAERKVGLLMELRVTRSTLSLTAWAYREKAFPKCTVFMDAPEGGFRKAETPQQANVLRCLSKFGGTPYSCEKLDIFYDSDGELFVPASLLSKARQELLARGAEYIEENRRKLRSLTPSPSPSGEGSNMSCRGLKGEYKAGSQYYSLPSPDGEGEGVRLLMQCKHCIRFAMGCCPKMPEGMDNRQRLKEPLSLRMSDGRTFPLQFDCKRCQMNVLKNE